MPVDTPSFEILLFDALDALTRGDVAPWSAMFTDDGVMQFPFAPPGYPEELVGREAIADFIQTYPESVQLRTITKHAVYHDGSTLIAEFDGEGTAVQTGTAFRMGYVAIITVQDGGISRYRDYWNPLVAIEAMGSPHAVQRLGGGADR